MLRELCRVFPETLFGPLQLYLPWLARIITLTMQPVSKFVEVWCIMEGVYYVFAKLYILWLQCKDPLEASLSSAPMMELEDRQLLWQRMLETEEDPVSFLSGWFFDSTLEQISKYDIRDFLAWSMFEGRNQEHLTSEELAQLERFVEDLEWRIGIHLYGVVTDDEDEEKEDDTDNDEKNDQMTELLNTPPRFKDNSLDLGGKSDLASPSATRGFRPKQSTSYLTECKPYAPIPFLTIFLMLCGNHDSVSFSR